MALLQTNEVMRRSNEGCCFVNGRHLEEELVRVGTRLRCACLSLDSATVDPVEAAAR